MHDYKSLGVAVMTCATIVIR